LSQTFVQRYIGRRPLVLACALLDLVFDYPLFPLAIRGGTFASLLMALMCNAVFQALYTGTIPSILAEMFPTRVRYMALCASYGFAVVLFGGFAPLISTWLVEVTANPFAPAFYVMTAGALSAIAILSMRVHNNTALDSPGRCVAVRRREQRSGRRRRSKVQI
jgi:MFS transporter, MHS family, proline/betaine transporter